MTVINEEGKTPFNPCKMMFPEMMKLDVNDKHLKKMFKKGKKMFKKMMMNKGKCGGCPFKQMKEMFKCPAKNEKKSTKCEKKPMSFDE